MVEQKQIQTKNSFSFVLIMLRGQLMLWFHSCAFVASENIKLVLALMSMLISRTSLHFFCVLF